MMHKSKKNFTYFKLKAKILAEILQNSDDAKT